MLKKATLFGVLFTLLFIPYLDVSAQSKQDDWFYNPFSKESAHHRPIGADAIYASEGDETTKNWKRADDKFSFNVGIPWGRSVGESNSSIDPVVTVRQRSNESDMGLPVEIPLKGGKFETQGDGTGDTEIIIYDRHKNEVFELRKWNWNNGSPTAHRRWKWDIKGLGHGSDPSRWEPLGNSASGTAGLFGLLRGWEINTPGQRIGHALQAVAPAAERHSPGRHILSKEIVWPANARDYNAKNEGSNLGTIPYGGLMAIPPESKGGPNLKSLGLSEAGLRLAEALRDYGLYIVDTGSNVALRADQFVDPDIRRQLVLDSYKIYPYLRLVKNNSKNQSTAGGGTPLAPNTAIDSNDNIATKDDGSENLSPPKNLEVVTIHGSETTPQSDWNLVSVDSEEVVNEDGRGINAFDGDPNTFWHTEWSASNPPPPHEIQIDLGEPYKLEGFYYLPRQDGNSNGRIKDYAFYVSSDGFSWGDPVASGAFPDSAAEQQVTFNAPITGQFIRLVALSEVHNRPWTSVGELKVLGGIILD